MRFLSLCLSLPLAIALSLSLCPCAILTWYHRQHRGASSFSSGPISSRQKDSTPAFSAKDLRFHRRTCVFSLVPAFFSTLYLRFCLESVAAFCSPLGAPSGVLLQPSLLVVLLPDWIFGACCFFCSTWSDRSFASRKSLLPSLYPPLLIVYIRWTFTSSRKLASSTLACCFFWTAACFTHTR